jgi:hypothetical protein
LRLCPRLRHGGGDVYTTAGSTPYGVIGEVFKKRSGKLVQVEPSVEVPLEAFHRLEYALATQLLIALDDLRSAPARLPLWDTADGRLLPQATGRT